MDELLPYYNRELSFIRKLGAEFSQSHPKIAGRLRMSSELVEDPHVSRMIEAFALLTARVRRKIDDDFPEVAQSVLEVLYPHFLRPFPSSCIAQFELDKAMWANTEPLNLPRGTGVETEPVDGEPCRFRTSYPIRLWPIRVAEAAVHGLPLPAPPTRFTPNAAAVIQLRLETLSSKVRFSDLSIGSLRFFLHGQSLYMHELYERLHNNTLGVAVCAPGVGENAIELSAASVEPVGFGCDEGLVDYDARSNVGYRLLTEFFSSPEKFLFADITGLTPSALERVGGQNQLELYVYLDEASDDLGRNVSGESFKLGCSPIANLFTQRAEPIRLTGQTFEHQVCPDARRPKSHEVYSIDKVVVQSSDDRQIELAPLYSLRHGRSDEPSVLWHGARRPSTVAMNDIDYGTEIYLSLVDEQGVLASLKDCTLDIETTCVNRDLPGRLPFGGGQPVVRLSEGGAVAKVRCLTPPTPTHRPALEKGVLWRLISKLSLNHASLIDGVEGAAALREVLSLYDLLRSDNSRSIIEGLTNVSSRRIVGRIDGGTASGFCRGVEVTLTLDEDRLTGGEKFLYASVLERFIALYASINSFTKLRVMTNRREGALKAWPPRAGERVLA